MIPADRVARPDQWQVDVIADESSPSGKVRLVFAGFPGTLAFHLTRDEALQLVQALSALTRQYVTEAVAGPLKVSVTDYHTPPRSRVLEMRFTGPFPGECSALFTDVVARRMIADLTATVQRLLEVRGDGL